MTILPEKYPTIPELIRKLEKDGTSIWTIEQEYKLRRESSHALRSAWRERTNTDHLKSVRRIIRTLAKRAQLKPYGRLYEGCAIVEVDLHPYVIPQKWVDAYEQTKAHISKKERLLSDRRNNVLQKLQDLNPNRYITEVTLTNLETPVLKLEIGARKYSKKVIAIGPKNWLQHLTKSNMDFIVLHSKLFEDEGNTLFEVTGWWKRDLKEGEDNYPVHAWLAEDTSGIRTITKHKHTAISGLNIRTTNKVLKTLAA